MPEYFIRVPVPGKERFEFVHVDIDRIHPGVTREIFVRAARKDVGGVNPHTQYMPFLGGTLAADSIDTTEFTGVFEDLLSQIRTTLESYEQSGTRVFNLVNEIASLPKIVEAAANGHMRTATDLLQDIMYAIMGTGCELAGELRGVNDTASGTAAALEHMHATMESKDDITIRLFTEWAMAAANLNEATDHLDQLEEEWRSGLASVENGRGRWKTALSETGPVMAAAVTFLDAPEEPEKGFLFRAAQYLQDPQSVPDMETMFSAARRIIEECRVQESKALRERDEFKAFVESTVFPRKPEMEHYLGLLEEATRQMADLESRFPDEGAKPHEVKNGALILREDFEKSERLLSDPKWGPLTCRRRMEGLLGSILSLLQNPPRIAEAVAEILTVTERYIAEIEEELTKPASAPASAAVLSPANADEDEPDGPLPMDVPIDEARLNELTQIAMCVGYVLTCNQYFLAVSNARPMLRVAQEAGLCTEGEVLPYSTHVERILRQEDMCETVDASRVSERRTKSSAIWLTYNTKANVFQNRGLKMTVHGGKIAKGIMEKMGLTEEAIVKAHEARRLKSRQLALKRKSEKLA